MAIKKEAFQPVIQDCHRTGERRSVPPPGNSPPQTHGSSSWFPENECLRGGCWDTHQASTDSRMLPPSPLYGILGLQPNQAWDGTAVEYGYLEYPPRQVFSGVKTTNSRCFRCFWGYFFDTRKQHRFESKVACALLRFFPQSRVILNCLCSGKCWCLKTLDRRKTFDCDCAKLFEGAGMNPVALQQPVVIESQTLFQAEKPQKRGEPLKKKLEVFEPSKK